MEITLQENQSTFSPSKDWSRNDLQFGDLKCISESFVLPGDTSAMSRYKMEGTNYKLKTSLLDISKISENLKPQTPRDITLNSNSNNNSRLFGKLKLNVN